MDNLRYLMVVLVVLYHSVAAYAVVAPHWPLHDTSIFGASIVRELFDVFLMPTLFFLAGYFALTSLKNRGPRKFLEDKVKRLLMPWALGVFVVLPLALYDQPVKPVRPFWRYWLSFLGGFQVHLRPTETAVTVSTQSVYWFVSLLFAFFLALTLGHMLTRRRDGEQPRSELCGSPSGPSVLVTLAAFGLLMSAVYFASLLVVPDPSWCTLSIFLEFQVTRVALYAGCFAFGVYAQRRGWLADGKPLGSIAAWGASSVVLGAAFLLFGRPMFVPASAAAQSVAYLLAFACLRSFLLVSILVVFLSAGVRFWNRASGFDRRLAGTSFDIYLVHLFLVVGLQEALLKWSGGPAAVKIAIVFLTALALSFAVARWILARHARAFTVVILALFTLCLVIRP
jgi:hypothetical protein